MKKILLIIISVLLLALNIKLVFGGISLGAFKVSSIEDVKNNTEQLENKMNSASVLIGSKYPAKISDLSSKTDNLQELRIKFEEKTKNITENEILMANQVLKYKIEYIWTIIGNYATEEGVTLKLDIVSANTENYFNLKFAVAGEYIPITNFIYDLEDDNELKFEINNFVMQSTTAQNATTQKEEFILQAQFDVNNLYITFN